MVHVLRLVLGGDVSSGLVSDRVPVAGMTRVASVCAWTFVARVVWSREVP
jgi:hypothetical protein